MTEPRPASLPLPLEGGALELLEVSGLSPDGWLNDPFRAVLVSCRALDAVEIEGFVPYAREGGAIFVAEANGRRSATRVDRSGRFAWTVPCRVESGGTLELAIRPEIPYVPAETGSADRRRLAFRLLLVRPGDPGAAAVGEMVETADAAAAAADTPPPFCAVVSAAAPAAEDGTAASDDVFPADDTVRICPDPVFIVGSPRSGTTMLAHALAAHSAFCTHPETVLPISFFGQDRARAIFEAATAGGRRWLRRIGMDQAEFDRWLALSMNALITSRAGSRRWIEQSPSTTAVAVTLAEAIPGARFLHIVRDGREVVHSMVNSGFDREFARDFAVACRQWRNHVHGAVKLEEAFPDRVLRVSYRDLVADPEGEFARIAAFLGEPDEPGPASFVRTSRVNSSFDDDARRRAAWTGWTEDRRVAFVEIAGPMMDRVARLGLVDPGWRGTAGASSGEGSRGGRSAATRDTGPAALEAARIAGPAASAGGGAALATGFQEGDTVRICPDPVFIVGSPRSGTTVLARALAAHSAFCTHPETGLPLSFFGNGRAKAIHDAAAEPGFWLPGIGMDRMSFDRWLAVGMNALITAHAGGKRWVEQSPSTTAVATAVAGAIPGARFLHIARDGREVVHSMINTNWDRPFARDFGVACGQWRIHLRQALLLEEALPDRVLQVPYRDLVSDPEREFARIAAFLGERDEPGPAAFLRANRIHSSFIDDARRNEAWTGWTEDRRRTFVEIAGPTMDRIAALGVVDPAWRDGRDALPNVEPDGTPSGGDLPGGEPGEMPDPGAPVISTVALSWNRADLLRRTLETYLATVSVPYELIVVDNGSTDGAREVIAEFCEGRPNHRAILLDENLGGEALNLGIARARGEFVHVSENDLEYLPGWDAALLAKFDAFPDLGQLSLFPAGNHPATQVEANGQAILVAEGNVVSSSMVRRCLFEAGLRWHTRGKGAHRPPADARFSGDVKALGHLVAWMDQEFVSNVGFDPHEIAGRLEYYIGDSLLKTNNLVWLARRLSSGGYLLINEGDGWKAVRRRSERNRDGGPWTALAAASAKDGG